MVLAEEQRHLSYQEEPPLQTHAHCLYIGKEYEEVIHVPATSQHGRDRTQRSLEISILELKLEH